MTMRAVADDMSQLMAHQNPPAIHFDTLLYILQHTLLSPFFSCGVLLFAHHGQVRLRVVHANPLAEGREELIPPLLAVVGLTLCVNWSRCGFAETPISPKTALFKRRESRTPLCLRLLLSMLDPLPLALVKSRLV